jgi:hypothetical protein
MVYAASIAGVSTTSHGQQFASMRGPGCKQGWRRVRKLIEAQAPLQEAKVAAFFKHAELCIRKYDVAISDFGVALKLLPAVHRHSSVGLSSF